MLHMFPHVLLLDASTFCWPFQPLNVEDMEDMVPFSRTTRGLFDLSAGNEERRNERFHRKKQL